MNDNLESLNHDGGYTVKMDLDYSAMCDEKIAVVKSLRASGKLHKTLDTLLVKKNRNGTNKKQQLKLAFEVMINECHTLIDQVPDKETKLKLVESLRVVTEEKVELVLDQLTLKLAQIKESEGDITGAANITQELQVEAHGSMKTQEEVELVFEQFELYYG